MLWTDIKADWKTYQKKFQTKWTKLTDEDLKAIAGKREELITRLMKRYGFEKNRIEKDVEAFVNGLKKPMTTV